MLLEHNIKTTWTDKTRAGRCRKIDSTYTVRSQELAPWNAGVKLATLVNDNLMASSFLVALVSIRESI